MADRRDITIEVIHRDICSAACIISGKDWSIPFPSVLFVEHPRFPGFENAKAVLKSTGNGRVLSFPARGMEHPFPGLPFPGGIFREFEHGNLYLDPTGIRRFAAEATAFSSSGQEPGQGARRGASYFPGVGRVHDYAILHYLGADILDSVQLILAARDGKMLFPDGELDAGSAGRTVCSCPACVEFHRTRAGRSKRDFDSIYLHNCHAASVEMGRIRHAIEDGQFRSFVERRCTVGPGTITLLRLLDSGHFEWQEKRTPRLPLGRSRELKITTAESLHRPDIERFRRHVRGEYRKPPSADILLLLPCSARKPYSRSKTHRMIHEAIRRPGLYRVHEVIVTSPMGLVPRELEMFPPVPFYDISVTGDWTPTEREMITGILGEYLQNNRYRVIINHFDEPGRGFVDAVLMEYCNMNNIDYHCTMTDRAIDARALERLRGALGEALTVEGGEDDEKDRGDEGNKGDRRGEGDKGKRGNKDDRGDGGNKDDRRNEGDKGDRGNKDDRGDGGYHVMSGGVPGTGNGTGAVGQGGGGSGRYVEDMRNRLRAQFGAAASCFGEDFRVRGRYPRLKIMDAGGKQLGMLTPERGLASLTLAGAERLAAAGRYCVEIDDFTPGGDIFAAGVLSATSDIRAGDEVAVVHGEEVRACGIARMHGPEMASSRPTASPGTVETSRTSETSRAIGIPRTSETPIARAAVRRGIAVSVRHKKGAGQ